MITLSYSSTADARSCWKKYYFRNIMDLQPKTKTRGLGIGTVIHECFEKYFNHIPKDTIIGHIKNAYDTQKAQEMDPSRVENLEIDKNICLGMWEGYPFNDLDFEVVKPEKEFEVRINGLRGVRFKGKVDGLVKKDGKWWIREVKTTSLSYQQFQGRSAVSYQASGYVYGIEKQEKVKVNGILYDMIKKPLLRKGVDETTKDFSQRVFNEYVDSKKKDYYYARSYSYRSGREISEFEKDIINLAREMRKRIRHNDWYRNTDACWTFGSECPYKRICWMENLDKNMLEAYYEIK